MELCLSSFVDKEGAAWVDVQGRCQQPGPIQQRVAASQMGNVILSALGGRGGTGGHGGRGGDGGRGFPGQHATEFAPGENGRRGGDGGDGGLGSHGANGGQGGLIRVHVAEQDSYLLMAVQNSVDGLELVRGGAGGSPGSHGAGGAGGHGGPGGRPYSSTKTRTKYNPVTKINETVTDTCFQAGGFSGANGATGQTPPQPLCRGADGPPGKFLISVGGTWGRTNYSGRYDLACDSFQLVEKESPDRDGIFEFGETVLAQDFVVNNLGAMPTPSQQRILLQLLPGRFTRPLPGGEEYLPRNSPLAPQRPTKVKAQLPFQIGYPDTSADKRGHDYDPIQISEEVVPTATQLGWETASNFGVRTSFQRQYEGFCCKRVLTAQWPVQNTRGLTGLGSLSPGEGTLVSFSIKNISSKPLGAASARKRRVCLQIRAATDLMIGSKDLHFVPGSSGDSEEVDLSREQGHWVEIDQLEAKSSNYQFQARLTLRPTVPFYGEGQLRAVLLLEDIQNPGTLLPIQRRKLTVKCEPVFAPGPTTRAILVCSSATSRAQYDLWRQLLSESFGLSPETFSVTRYGHLDLRAGRKSEGGEGSPPLGEQLLGKVVVVLDDPFEDPSSLKKSLVRPSDLLAAWNVRGFAANSGTVDAVKPPNFLIVTTQRGSSSSRPAGQESLAHLSAHAPPVREPVLRWAFESVEELQGRYCQADRFPANAPSSSSSSQARNRADPDRDALRMFDLVPVFEDFCICSPPSAFDIRDVLLHAAERLAHWLRRHRPDLCGLITCVAAEPEMVSSCRCIGLRHRWRLGYLRVHTFVPGSQYPRLTHLVLPTEGAPSMPAVSRFAVARALGLGSTVQVTSELLTRCGAASTSFTEATAGSKPLTGQALQDFRGALDAAGAATSREALLAIVHGLLAEIALEYVALIESAFPALPISPCGRSQYPQLLKEGLPTLSALLEAEHLFGQVQTLRQDDPVRTILLELPAGLEAMAAAPGLRRWYAPFGRRRRAALLLEWAAMELLILLQLGPGRRGSLHRPAEYHRRVEALLADLQEQRGINGGRSIGPTALARSKDAVQWRFGAGGFECNHGQASRGRLAGPFSTVTILPSPAGPRFSCCQLETFFQLRGAEVVRESAATQFTTRMATMREQMRRGVNADLHTGPVDASAPPEAAFWPSFPADGPSSSSFFDGAVPAPSAPPPPDDMFLDITS